MRVHHRRTPLRRDDRPREAIVDGLDRLPDALLMLFRGENMGKLVLKVAAA